jgi:hypothetical protein
MAVPPPIVYGNPPDDPNVDLHAWLYLPNATQFPPPWPTVIGIHANGFSGGGPNPLDQPFVDLSAEGFFCITAETRLMRGGVLPGQTTDGKFEQQTDDVGLAIQTFRADPRCIGFVAGLGGSGSAHHVTYRSLVGTEGDDRFDAAVAMSPVTDMGDREADMTLQFIDITTDYGRSLDLAVLTSRSPIAFINAGQPPILHYNGTQESMPFSQFTRFRDAVAAAGVTNYSPLPVVGSNKHSFSSWIPYVRVVAIPFLKNAFAQWNGGAGGGMKPQPAGCYDLINMGTDAAIPDITAKPFLTHDNIVGCRIRPGWSVIQPASAAVYDWTALDAALAVCAAAGKKMGISIAAGVRTPDWVYTTGTPCTKFELAPDDQSVNNAPPFMPLPWQAGFQGKWETFVNAFGAKYDGNPFVDYVVITGFMQNNELHFIGTVGDLALTDAIAQADGFIDTNDAYLPAAHDIIDMFVAAFPNTTLILSLGRPLPDPQGQPAQNDIELYGKANYPLHFGTMTAFLKAKAGAVLNLLLPLDPAPKGAQPLHASTSPDIYEEPVPVPIPPPPQPLQDLLYNGANKGNKYIEIYEPDLQSPDPTAQAIITIVNDFLLDLYGPLPLPVVPAITSPLIASGTVGELFTYQITATHSPTSFAASNLPFGFTIDTVTGLITGTPVGAGAFQIALRASNTEGEGPESVLLLTVAEAIIEIPAVPLRTPILSYPIGGLPPLASHAPSSPLNLLVEPSQVPGQINQAQATWLPPIDPGGTLLNYEATLTGGFGVIPIIPGTATSVLLTSLLPATLYTFSLAAVTSFGKSEPTTADFLTASDEISLLKPQPRGVIRYLEQDTNLVPIYDVVNAPFWDKSYIDGSRYYIGWNLIQPNNADEYDWSNLDAYLDLCSTYGKKAGVSVTAGLRSPEWLRLTQGVSWYTVTTPFAGVFPNPGNTKVKFYWNQFVTAFGQRYDSHPQIAYIVPTNIGQFATTFFTSDVDYQMFQDDATQFGFATVVDYWFFIIKSVLLSYLRSFATTPIVVNLDFPVPIGTVGLDGNDGLNMLVTWLLQNGVNRSGLMNNFLTAAAATTDLRHKLLADNSPTWSTGVKYEFPSTDPQCDPAQDPTPGVYDPEKAFSRADNKAGTLLKVKFAEILHGDADNLNVQYVNDMEALQAGLLLNP